MNRILPQEVVASIQAHGLKPERLLYFHLGTDQKPCVCGLTAACIGRAAKPAETIAALSTCDDDEIVVRWAEQATGSVCYVRGFVAGFDADDLPNMPTGNPDYCADQEGRLWEHAQPFDRDEYLAGFADGVAAADLSFSTSGELQCQPA